MLTLKLDDIPEEGIDLRWVEDVDALSDYLGGFPEIDFEFEGPLFSEARIRKVGHSILVKGRVTTTLRLRCVRCLKEFSYPLTSPLEVSLHPVKGVMFPEEIELTREDLESNFFEGGELHLSEIACEQVFLEIPIQSLCHETCQGLCPYCGTDLNLSSCACTKEKFNSAFGVLKQLKLH